jgi:hypothetical protein
MSKVRKVSHGRIKERYNPTPTPAEKLHHLRLIALPCICCGRDGGIVHHVLTSHIEKRWRRDHEWVLPMNDDCHRSLHSHGKERLWCEDRGFDPVHEAAFLRLESISEGIL